MPKPGLRQVVPRQGFLLDRQHVAHVDLDATAEVKHGAGAVALDSGDLAGGVGGGSDRASRGVGGVDIEGVGAVGDGVSAAVGAVPGDLVAAAGGVRAAAGDRVHQHAVAVENVDAHRIRG